MTLDVNNVLVNYRKSKKEFVMSNLDMKKTLKHLYAPSAKDISIVTLSPMNYLMIDGEGNPAGENYLNAVKALYSLAYGIRAISKEAGQVFTVMPLEGLWSFEGQENSNFVVTDADKDTFEWTLMILQPEHITSEIAEQARDTVRKKKSLEFLESVRFESYDEGDAVQILHIGSYDNEGETVARLHHHIEEQGWQLGKKHHEIYLNDPRKVVPEKLKTIIRQPFIR